MGIINVKIDNETEDLFRIKLLQRKGARKGAMGESVAEALRGWIYSEKIWVQDLEKDKAQRYIKKSEEIYPKLKYSTGKPVRDTGPEMVGMYYTLRPGAEP